VYSFFPKPALWSGIIALGLAASCSPKKTDDQATTEPEKQPLASADTAPAAPGPVAPTRLSLTDSANLSPKFLKGLRELTGSEAYQVRGKWLVLDQQDSVAFPLDLPANKAVSFTSQKEGQTITLTLTRLSYTSIRFAAEAVGGTASTRREEGVAELNPGFYLAAEAPDDSQSHTTYGAAEYLCETPTRNFSILVGLGPDADKAELGVYDATGKPVAQWQGVPTLRRPAL
jgi:hypothetical protein